MTHPHYFQHDPSGEVYVITVGENGMFGDVCGPLAQEEQTAFNLLADTFHYDEDDQSWAGSQTWHMIGPDHPSCDCSPNLKLYQFPTE